MKTARTLADESDEMPLMLKIAIGAVVMTMVGAWIGAVVLGVALLLHW